MQIRGTVTIGTILLAASAYGQSITGTITGVVEDPTGARVPTATIEAVDQDTNVHYPAGITAAGLYTIAELPLGHYTVTAEASGFKKTVRNGLEVTANAILRLDMRLQLGASAETVTVTGAAPLVESERATLGGSFTQKDFDALPIGRDPLNTLALVPGSTPGNGGFATGVFNGGHEETTDYKVDGAAATLATTYRAGTGPIEEMVEQVVLQSSNYSAESGRGSSQISINTISGTNQFHGVLFEYFQNEDLNANSFFNNLHGTPRSINRQNLFGATLGGPIWIPKVYNGHNRTFFTFGFEGTRSYTPASYVSTVPSLAMRSGNFAGLATIYDPATTTPNGSSYTRTPFPGNVIPTTRFDKVALNILANSYPLPNAPGTASGANNYNSAGSSPLSNTELQGRVDHNFNEKHRLTARYLRWYQGVYNFDRWLGPSGAPTKNNVQNNDNQDTTLSLEYDYIMRADMINTLRWGYFREHQGLSGPGTDANWAGTLGLKGAGPQEFPLVAITGLTGFGGANLTNSIPADNQSLADTLALFKGRHSLKIGFEYRYLRDNTYTPGAFPAGSFTFDTQPTDNPANKTLGNGFASYLLGIPSGTSISATPPNPYNITWQYYSFFVQDDFHLSKRLTLNLGLRWEINTPYRESHNYMSAFNLQTQQLDLAGVNGYPDTLFNTNYKTFGPRLGLAYSLSDDNKTVVRAGWGLFWLPNSAIGGSPFTATGPWAQTLAFPTPDGVTFPLTLAGGIPPIPLNQPVVVNASLGVNTVQRYFTPPYMEMWNVNVQRQLGRATMLQVGYVANQGHHLESNMELNQVPANLLGPGNAQLKRPYPNVGSIRDGAAGTPIGNSDYNALQVSLQHRFQHGFSAQVAYTFSKSLDEFLGNLSFGSFASTNVQNYDNINGERSLSVFNQPEKLDWAFVYQLPVGKGRDFLNRGGWVDALIGGWNLSSLSSLESGMPLVFTTANNLTGSIDGGSRPNRLANGLLSGSQRGINEWFNPAAFVAPPAYTFGSDSRTEPQLYAPGALSISAQLQKEIHFGEKRFFEFRCQASNLLNHFNPGAPNTNIGAPGVGTITSGNGGRGLVLVLKLHY